MVQTAGGAASITSVFYNEKRSLLDPLALTLWYFVAQVKGAHLYVLPMVFMAFVTVASCLGGQIKKFTYNNNGYGSYSFE